MRYLDKTLNFYKSKLPFFHIFRGTNELNFLKIYIYVNKATLPLFDIKFNYIIGTNRVC